MAQQQMYSAIANSPGTELSAAITAAVTTIPVVTGSVLPEGPNIITIGVDETSETVLYTSKNGNSLIGCTRGFGGTTAKGWAVASRVARYYTAYDHEAFRKNLTDLSGVTSESTTDIVLSAGQQILNATKNARLQGLKVQGRTLIDLLGGAGSGESLTGWLQSTGVPVTTSATQKRSGSYSFKATSSASGSSYLYRDYSVPLDKTQQYVVMAWVYIESGNNTPEISLRDVGTFTNRYPAYATASKAGEWQLVVIKIPTSNTISTSGFRVLVGFGSPGVGVSYIDEVRLYAVSAADYAAIGTTITGEAIDRLLPYVPPGINGVDGFYVRRYGRNLLSDKPDTLNANAKMNGPYDITLTITTGGGPSTTDVPVKGGAQYYLRATLGASAGQSYINYYWVNSSGVATYLSEISNATPQGKLINTPSDCVALRFNMAGSIAGTFTFKDWQLELCNAATPFQPREDSLIAFGGVELHANPTDGSEPDILREVNGRYEVTRLWREMVLDGALPWEYNSTASGYKALRISKLGAVFSGNYIVGFATKYNGQTLVNTSDPIATAGADKFRQRAEDAYFYLSVSSADSGWGDSYTPSADEIKAYFNGWKMYDVNTNPDGGGVYNRTDGLGKWFVPVDRSTGGVNTLPTAKVTSVTPYQLLYRLASVTTETVQEEGALSLLEGDNFIEVGSGYVSRERVTPSTDTGNWYINNDPSLYSPGGDSRLKNKAREILNVFKDSRVGAWIIEKAATAGYGNSRANQPPAMYDPSASYSVSYIKLDKSPVPGVTGFYAASEKAQLHDLTDGVTEALARLSVVEAKKAEKDVPALITPTLLNGWEMYGSSNAPYYYKDTLGFVHIRGMVKSGVNGSPILTLPPGYRPSATAGIESISVSNNGSGVLIGNVEVDYKGRVTPYSGGTTWLSLDNIPPFLAVN
ncbi:hypothetical protein BK121_08900 [Paenibacillus odorifer]|uniref:hypothetical protein n=1 Tax=Paenibacillus odorifer TaxID=189426 RepID=UPI00096E86F0|nr:hypothetical protein [Paenibacillus odorifer]OMC73017.1 hypothetical protein BK121_08900 [Paenibacillus odorifer]